MFYVMEDYSFIAVSDVHLGAKLFNMPELEEDLKEAFRRSVDLALSLKVKYFIVVGDLFDTNKPTPDLVMFVSEQVKKLGVNGCIAIGIAGDHDKPVNSSSWVKLSSIKNVSLEPRFIGYDYSDNSPEHIKSLQQAEGKANVEWIFLHGQVPELFSYTEDKKRLDFKEFDILGEYPALKGIILGDIHTPIEGSLFDPTNDKRNVFLGYCGSLGTVKSDEVGTKIGILHFDGKILSRKPFKQIRKFIRMRLTEQEFEHIDWVDKYYKFFKEYPPARKPVFIIEYTSSTEHLLSKIQKLYDVAMVKTLHVVVKEKNESTGKEEVVNLRSEIKTSERMISAMKLVIPDQEVAAIALSLLTCDDPTVELDKLKTKFLNERNTVVAAV